MRRAFASSLYLPIKHVIMSFEQSELLVNIIENKGIAKCEEGGRLL